MLARHFALAARQVTRTKLYAAINVIGLAIGFAAATLIGLYLHDELTYEHWIPDSERIYQVSATTSYGQITGTAPGDLGVWLKSDYPQFEAVTRTYLAAAFFAVGDKKFADPISWADSSLFDVFRFPVLAGNLDGALDAPDSLVLTRTLAEKYFGTVGAAVGQTILYNGEHPMVITAVIEELPSSTHLVINRAIGASHAPYSPTALQDRTPMEVFGGKAFSFATYVLLKPNEPLAPIRESLRTLVDRHVPQVLSGDKTASEVWPLVMRPIRAIHLSTSVVAAPDAVSLARVYSVAAIGLLILLVASINFVNLLTAIGVRRALEVGVRKALGARRRDLFAQFMSESFLYVGVGALAGLGLGLAGLAPLNAYLRRTIDLSMFADWRISVSAAAFLAAVGLLAGLYPALVLSSYRPALVTKGGRAGRAPAGVRQALVLLQFAVLIALSIATTVTYRQNALATREMMRQSTNPVVILPTGLGGCSDALMAEMRRAQGVLDAACTQLLPAWGAGARGPLTRRGREQLPTAYFAVGFGFFELFGFELAAGRFFSAELGTDQSPPDNVWTTPESLLINETAARALGFADPRDAVGETMTFGHLFRQPATFTPQHDATIIGVLKDFQIGRVTEATPPAAFFVDPAQFIVMTIKLDGLATPEALDAIDRVWDRYGGPAPTQRFFLEDSVERIYYDLKQQSRLFAVFAGLAVLIATLGLVGLAAHAAASRTREIGIRKVLGGGRWAISRLLLWQFSVPVLLANLVAWPVAYWAMSVWLGGFVNRVDLDAWMFVAAGAATLVVAVAAVWLHTWKMSGTRPVAALRYE